MCLDFQDFLSLLGSKNISWSFCNLGHLSFGVLQLASSVPSSLPQAVPQPQPCAWRRKEKERYERMCVLAGGVGSNKNLFWLFKNERQSAGCL